MEAHKRAKHFILSAEQREVAVSSPANRKVACMVLALGCWTLGCCGSRTSCLTIIKPKKATTNDALHRDWPNYNDSLVAR